jgi:hypothetical protein
MQQGDCPMASWLPQAARADIACALRDAREFKHAPTLMYGLT